MPWVQRGLGSTLDHAETDVAIAWVLLWGQMSRASWEKLGDGKPVAFLGNVST